MKTRKVFRQNYSALHEAAHNGTYPGMDYQLGSDEYRKCDEESDMHLYIMKEGEATAAPSQGAEAGKHGQRQPCEQGDDEQPTMQEFQPVSSEARFAQELEDRAPQYHREINWFMEESGSHLRMEVFRCRFFVNSCHRARRVYQKAAFGTFKQAF